METLRRASLMSIKNTVVTIDGKDYDIQYANDANKDNQYPAKHLICSKLSAISLLLSR